MLGEYGFRRTAQRVLAQVSGRLGAEHYGEERAATEEAKAERIIAAELKPVAVAGSRAEDAGQGGRGEVAVAARLRAETTMTVGWIAERLGMGTRGHLNHLLCRGRKSDGE